jgi:tetratricopeptide (TPR) repeat protein
MGITLSEILEYEEAVKAFKKALKLKPDEYEICYHLGAALIELKRYDEAAKVYKSTLQVKPSDSEVFYNLSIVYSLLRKHDIALDNLKRAVELNHEIKNDARFNPAFDSIRMKDEFKKLVLQGKL